jgi:hypothetical protein
VGVKFLVMFAREIYLVAPSDWLFFSRVVFEFCGELFPEWCGESNCDYDENL